MKKLVKIGMILLPLEAWADPHTFSWPAMPNPKTVGEFLNIPPAKAGTHSIMSLKCFYLLNPELFELGLNDFINEGQNVTFDTSCVVEDDPQ